MRHLWRKAALAGLLTPALALGVAQGTALAAGAAITDPTGDVYDDQDNIIVNPAADIVSADASRAGGNLTLTYTTAKPTDPETDPAWGSLETYTDFLLDTNGDGKEDFAVEYSTDDDDDINVDVYKMDGSDQPPVVCSGTGTFAGGAYTAVVPLSCLGTVTTLGYQVAVNHDTDVNVEGKVVYDDAPETGFSPVA